ncbi:sigma-70 family RNA polymerase sigma factor [Evansella sp. AB-rgal1]|uniref:sigma-70 family RNA polymerase sigma factor n=1 Tax=Evansella sp. AB-rgal1 TaxID=3242696 RepID=UPI00359DF93A
MNERKEFDLSFQNDQDRWLETIMDGYGEKLTKLAYNYVKDWRLAEDIVQDVFITCYEQYGKLNEISFFKAWIYRITINKAKDILKSSSIKRVVIDSGLFRVFTSKDPTPEMAMMKRSEHEVLSNCVLSLPIKYREAIILYYYEELSIDEISTILKVNRNTLKTRLDRGREKVKKQMERWEGNGE